jgi:hypothetical protein
MALTRGLCVALVALAFTSDPARAQGLTGTLLGTVKDARGGVLQGAVVRITSPALMTGEQATTSDDRGQWRFLVLPPGEYVLTVELAPRFRTSGPLGIQVRPGETLDKPVTLTLAGVTETVNVNAATAAETRRTGMEARFGPDYLRNMPSRRYSMFSAINAAPGVSPTAPASGSINTLSVFGSAVNENLFLIDGTNFTCPCQGVSRAEPINDVIQEVHVQTMGASVEFGNFQGGVINVVTRQGGPRLAAEASYYGQWPGLTAQPVTLPIARTQMSSGYERVMYRDFSTSAGGPIWRERLWFFGAYQYLRDFDSQPGVDPDFPRKYEQNKVFGKLNWQLTPTTHLMQSFHMEKWVNPQAPTVVMPFVTTQRVHASVPNMTFADLRSVVSNRTVFEARVGRFMLDQYTDPASGDVVTPHHRDQVTGMLSGNAPLVVYLRLDRVTGKAVLHHHRAAWLGADHQFRFGTQFERGLHRKSQFFPGGVQYIDNNTAPFQAVYRAPATYGGDFITGALFASDSFSVRDRLVVDAGVRFDHSRAINPDLPGIDAEGSETDEVLPGRGTIYTWNVFSPRLGARLKIDEGGRSVLRATYGLFNQGVLTGELDPISQGATETTTTQFDPATGGYTRPISVVDPKINLAIDTATRPPHTHEFSVAFDREITQTVRASVAYVGKRGRAYLGWTDVAGAYRTEQQTVAGVTVPVHVLTSPTKDRRFLLANLDNFLMNYDGVVVAGEKRMSNDWYVSGSYTYSRVTGLQAASNLPADAGQASTIAMPEFLTFGQDPNDLTNAYGRLPNDRPHVFRVTGSVRLPWQGITVAANVQHFSGKPWAAAAPVSLPQGSRKILLEPRGTRRLSSQSLLDLRVAKSIVTGRAGTIHLTFDMLNTLNDTAEEALATDNPSAVATFGTASRYIDPRRVMFGVRFSYGR